MLVTVARCIMDTSRPKSRNSCPGDPALYERNKLIEVRWGEMGIASPHTCTDYVWQQ